jgi:transposase
MSSQMIPLKVLQICRNPAGLCCQTKRAGKAHDRAAATLVVVHQTHHYRVRVAVHQSHHYRVRPAALRRWSACCIERIEAEQQTDDLDRKVLKLARYDAQVRRFMTVPGVGPITALCFKATIDDPTRFKRSKSVGAYVGLTTRRHASGEVDWTGRISKCGDAMLRSYLFEAAGVLLTRVPKWSAS